MAGGPLTFTIVGGIIGVAGSLGAAVLRHYFEKTEKQKDRIRSRGNHIEFLVDEYERQASGYWLSSSIPDTEMPRRINSLKKRISMEIGNIAEQKGMNCRASEVDLARLHRVATLHDSFNTAGRFLSPEIALHIQDAANEMRTTLHLDLDML